MAYEVAEFKAARLQREIPMDVKVSEKLEVGALCAYTAGTNTIAGATTIADATHIVAQSDMTMEYGHVPVENRDYRYSPGVAASSGSAVKKVALFKIINPDDVIVLN